MQPSPPPRLSLPLVELLKVMEVSRQGDRREGILLRQSRGWFQVAGMGHEAMAALAYALRPDDLVFPFYRDRALVLARGVTNYELALSFFAKAGSVGGGNSMPGHHSCARHNIYSVATPTASQCLPAAGAAWGLQKDGSDAVAVCCVGDATIRQGEYYEAVAFAVQENLPLVMVIQDNLYGISTCTDRQNPYRLGLFDTRIVSRVNGRDPREVHACASEAVARARAGGGPSVLWCELDRLSSHTSSDDHRVYRSADDIAAITERDPITVFARELIEAGELDAEEWDAFRAAAVKQVEEDYERASMAADTPLSEADACIVCDPAAEPPAEAPPIETQPAMTMVAAINATLHAGMLADPRVVMMGEDVEDPKGGVFGLTKGLSTAFPDRVHNAPLAEATIVGAAVGLAAAGWRPVFEIQFVDFILPALNQLFNQAATVRWRTRSDWKCPMVLIAPAGAYLPGGGPWHSQTMEGLFAHVPGIRVAMPSTPEDAAGLLWSAMHGDDPTIILVPKHIFRVRMPVPDPLPAVALGTCAVRRPGADVTVVAWGNTMEVAAEAAADADAEGVSVELVDLRTIVPADWEGIAASVARTGRLVVVHEDVRTCGFGQAIVAEMTAHPDRWNSFLSPPQLVTRPDTHVPFCPALEYAVLPSRQQVLDAIRLVME